MHKRSSYDVPFYILVVFLSIIVWTASFNLLHYPKSNECVYLFYAGTVKDYSIESEFKDSVESKELRKVSIMSCDTSINAFETKYQAMGLSKCDLCLVPYSVMETTYCEDSYLPISSYSVNVPENEELFIQEEVSYGIVINDITRAKLSNYFNLTEEDYVLGICASSVNAGEATTFAYDMLMWILN